MDFQAREGEEQTGEGEDEHVEVKTMGVMFMSSDENAEPIPFSNDDIDGGEEVSDLLVHLNICLVDDVMAIHQ